MRSFKFRWITIVLASVVMLWATGAVAEGEDEEGPMLAGQIRVDLGVEIQETGNPSEHSDSAFAYGGSGKFNLPIHGAWALQGDVQTQNSEQGASDSITGAAAVGVHVNYRNTDSFLVGGFFGLTQATHNDNDDNGSSGYLAGIEGQGYLGDKLTIYAQVGWADIEMDDSGFKDGVFSSLEGRVFLTEDCGLIAGAGYSSTGDARFNGNDLDAWNWKFEAFSRVSKTLPIYASLGYAGAQYDLDSSGAEETESHRVMVGFSVLFGATSALENDRRGATLNTPLEPTWNAGWAQKF